MRTCVNITCKRTRQIVNIHTQNIVYINTIPAAPTLEEELYERSKVNNRREKCVTTKKIYKCAKKQNPCVYFTYLHERKYYTQYRYNIYCMYTDTIPAAPNLEEVHGEIGDRHYKNVTVKNARIHKKYSHAYTLHMNTKITHCEYTYFEYKFDFHRPHPRRRTWLKISDCRDKCVTQSFANTRQIHIYAYVLHQYTYIT